MGLSATVVVMVRGGIREGVMGGWLALWVMFGVGLGGICGLCGHDLRGTKKRRSYLMAGDEMNERIDVGEKGNL